jgi:hypothetical protein
MIGAWESLSVPVEADNGTYAHICMQRVLPPPIHRWRADSLQNGRDLTKCYSGGCSPSQHTKKERIKLKKFAAGKLYMPLSVCLMCFGGNSVLLVHAPQNFEFAESYTHIQLSGCFMWFSVHLNIWKAHINKDWTYRFIWNVQLDRKYVYSNMHIL